MNIGALRHRVTIQSKSETEGRYGSPATEWVDGPTVWAQISPQSGRETDAADQTLGETTYEITMRYREIDHSQRLMHRGTVYDIRDVRAPNARDMLVLVCTTGTTNG